MAGYKTLGNRIAPARFIVFFLMLGGTIALATLIAPWWRSIMLGFDISSLVFIASCFRLFFAKPAEMRRISLENDANRAILLFLAFALGLVILVAVGSEIAGSGNKGVLDIAITIITLLVAWFFGNTVYALHYAHLFYSTDDGGKDHGGITFPGGDESPTFSDFVYVSFTIGSALSVSDNDITSPHIRRVVAAHTIVAFIYNVGIFALTVNMLAGNG